MRKGLLLALSAGWCCALPSCGTHGKDAAPAAQASVPAQKSGGGGLFGDEGKLLDKYASSNPMYTKSKKGEGIRTAMEGDKSLSLYNKELSRKNFQTKEYDRKAFWGMKDYAKQVYGGDTDGSRFLTPAREGTMMARDGGKVAHDAGQVFATRELQEGSAREAQQKEIPHVQDAVTENRRKVFIQPEKRSPPGARRAVSVEEVKALLGR